MLLGNSSTPPKGVPRGNIRSFPFQAPAPGQLQACLRRVLAAEGRPPAAAGPDHHLPRRDLRSGCLPQCLSSMQEPEAEPRHVIASGQDLFGGWARATGACMACTSQCLLRHAGWSTGTGVQNAHPLPQHPAPRLWRVQQPRQPAALHAPWRMHVHSSRQHGHPRCRAAGCIPPMRRCLLLEAQLQGQLPVRPSWQSLPCEDQLAYWHGDHDQCPQPGSGAPCQHCHGFAGHGARMCVPGSCSAACVLAAAVP